MLKGTRPAIIKRIQPVSIHGQVSYEISWADPDTPEDELKLRGYSFTPIVYRQRYRAAPGKDGAFFVLTYTVGK